MQFSQYFTSVFGSQNINCVLLIKKSFKKKFSHFFLEVCILSASFPFHKITVPITLQKDSESISLAPCSLVVDQTDGEHTQGMVDGSASKPALIQDTGYMVEKTYLDIAPYLGAFGAYLLPQ